MSLRTAVSTLAAAMLLGCATQGPYAEVSGEKIESADTLEEQVRVLGVDGKLNAPSSLTLTIEPGLRMVLLDTTRRHRMGKGKGKDSSIVVPLNAKPCLRYYFVARHESMSAVDPWQLVLKNVQPIPECVARFPLHKPVPLQSAG
jgi:hypothetical protein